MGKLMIIKVVVISLVFLCFIACKEHLSNPILQNESVIIDNGLYTSTITENYTITHVKLENNLLTIKISSSGCSGDSWKAVLVDADEILESNPIQRNIKIALENNKACLAFFSKEFTFDISILKEDFSELFLNLKGWNSQINYK